MEQLRVRGVLPSDYYYEEGMTDWARVATLPCCARFLASDAQKEMLTNMGVSYDEFLTKADVSRIMDRQPATERQLALIEYLGLARPPELTKNEASDLLEAAKQDPILLERLDSWNIDRLILHPNTYATERGTFKEGRAELLLNQYREFQSDLRRNGARVRNLSIEDVSRLVTQLDAVRPGWDREIALKGLDFLLDLLDD